MINITSIWSKKNFQTNTSVYKNYVFYIFIHSIQLNFKIVNWLYYIISRYIFTTVKCFNYTHCGFEKTDYSIF